ncbi:MAG: AmmeMemoRadiSam system protein B [Oscillospiraceae bacterium]|nr:AmmeMemoRadiSam system protein B [Oscillospiraceae bacterium]
MITSTFLLPHPPIILPQIGKGREREIAATITSCQEVAKKIAGLKPDTIVVASPHSTCYSDYFHISPGDSASGNLARFGAPEVGFSAEYDVELAAEISKNAADFAGCQGEQSPQLDHGVLVPLAFVSELLDGFKLVRIGVSGLSLETHHDFGKTIAASAKLLSRRIVFIASGDLSHVLPEEQGVKLDTKIVKLLKSGNLTQLLQIPPEVIENGAECGLRPLCIMAGVLHGLDFSARLLSYEGPFGVGYAVAEFNV